MDDRGQQRVGVLLRRMTLAQVGLDDLQDVSEGARETLLATDRFAERFTSTSRHIGVASRDLPVMRGVPDFLAGVQERYLPTNVDEDFGPDFALDGPRSPSDVGPWRDWLHAVYLMLFDEDEEDWQAASPKADSQSDAWRPQVTRQQVRQAVTKQLAQRRRRPTPPQHQEDGAEGVSPLVSLPLLQAIEAPSARRGVLSLSDREHASLFSSRAKSASLSDAAGIQSMKTARFAQRIAAAPAAPSLSLATQRALRPAAELAEQDGPMIGSLGASLADEAPAATRLYRSSGRPMLPGSLLALMPEVEAPAIHKAAVEGGEVSGSLFGEAEALAYPKGLGRAGRYLKSLPSHQSLMSPVSPELAVAIEQAFAQTDARVRDAQQLAEVLQPGVDMPAESAGVLLSSAETEAETKAAPAAVAQLDALLREESVQVWLKTGAAGAAPEAVAAIERLMGDRDLQGWLRDGAGREQLAHVRQLERVLDHSRQASTTSAQTARLQRLLTRDDVQAWLRTGRGSAATTQAVKEIEGLLSMGEVKTWLRASGNSAVAAALQTRLQTLTEAPAVRARLRQLSEAPTAAGRRLQMLADEPTARALRAARAAESGAVGDRLLSERPFIGSSLGFEEGDLVAARSFDIKTAVDTGRISIIDGSDDARVMHAAAFAAESGELLRPETELGEDLTRAASRRAALLRAARRAETAAVSADAIVSAAQRDVVRAAPPAAGAAARVAPLAIADQLGGVSAALSGTRTSAAAPVILGDVALSGRHLAGLSSSLKALGQRQGRELSLLRQLTADAESTAVEEALLSRMAKMLDLVEVRDDEDGVSTPLRGAVAALQRSGALPRTSRLAWQGSEPVLLSTREAAAEPSSRVSAVRGEASAASLAPASAASLASASVWAQVESQLSAEQIRQIKAGGGGVLGLSDVLPGLSQISLQSRAAAAEVRDERLAPAAQAALLKQLEARAVAAQASAALKTRSLESLSADAQPEQAALTQRLIQEVAATQRAASIGDVSRMMSFEKAARQIVPQVIATGGRREIVEELERLLQVRASEAPGVAASSSRRALRLSQDSISGADFVSVTPAQLNNNQPRRASLGLKGEGAAAITSAAAKKAAAAATSSASVQAIVDATRAPSMMVTQAESFRPQVTRSERFAPQAEAAAVAASEGGLSVEQTPSRLAMFSEDGALVRAAAQAQAEKARSGVSFTPSALEAMVTSAASQPAAINASVERRGGVSERVSSATIERAIQTALRQPGATPRAIVAQLERAVPGLHIDAESVSLAERAAERLSERQREASRPSLQRAVRSLQRVSEQSRALVASSVSSPASAGATRGVLGARGAGYFAGLVPSSFSSEAPARLMSQAFSAPEASLLVQRLASAGRLDQTSAALLASAERGELVESAPALAARGEARFEVATASGMSGLLQRLEQTQRSVDGSAPWQSGELVQPASSSEASERRAAAPGGQRLPGQLGGELEGFFPVASISANRAASTTASTRSVSIAASGADAGRGALLESSSTPAQQAQAVAVAAQRQLTQRLSRAEQQLQSTSSTQQALIAAATSSSPSAASWQEGLGDLFGMGSGFAAHVRGSKHDDQRMLDRIEALLDRAQGISERNSKVLGQSGFSQMPVVQVEARKPAADEHDGLPAWRRGGSHVQGVEVSDLREMLRQVGALPVQGQPLSSDRQLINPFITSPQAQQGAQAGDPLFSAGGGGAGGGAAAGGASDSEAPSASGASGQSIKLPPYSQLEYIASKVYKIILEKFNEALERRP